MNDKTGDSNATEEDGFFNITDKLDEMFSGHPCAAIPPIMNLPDGRVISLTDITWGNLRSAFIVTPYGSESRWTPFSTCLSQPVSGSIETAATRAHTNLWRSGDSGLPKDWEMLVHQWKARLNLYLEESVLDWAAETSVDYFFNERRYASATLADLLLDSNSVAASNGGLPVHMRELLTYRVEVETQNEKALRQLRHRLQGEEDAAPNIQGAFHQLGAIADLQRDILLQNSLRQIQKTLVPGRSLTCWISLEGPLKRCVV